MITQNTVDLSVSIGSVTLQNPVMPASGTFGKGLVQVVDLNRLGAFVTKSFTKELRSGNILPRIAEVQGGMLNAIGIPSRGLDYFVEETLPFYKDFSPPLVVSISASTAEDFASLAADLDKIPDVAVIEANISCPNLEEGGKAFAMMTHTTERVTKGLRKATRKPLWVKLTPNTGDMPSIAKAAETSGADAVIISNTVLGMAIDVNTFRPKLGNVMGGLSGPAIKPIILRHVFQCAREINIPIIGCGGITTADDAVEYLLAGATAVQVGTATFIQPKAMIDIIDGLKEFCIRKDISELKELIGGVLLDG